jgi:hypothetical protein
VPLPPQQQQGQPHEEQQSRKQKQKQRGREVEEQESSFHLTPLPTKLCRRSSAWSSPEEVRGSTRVCMR